MLEQKDWGNRMLETLVTFSILSENKLHNPGENWSSPVTSDPGKSLPSHHLIPDIYWISSRSSQVWDTGFQLIPPPGQIPSTSTGKVFPCQVSLFEGDVFYFTSVEADECQRKFSLLLFESMAKAGMISSMPRNPGVGPSLPSAREMLLHKHTAPAPAAAAFSFHCTAKHFPWLFPWGAVGCGQAACPRSCGWDNPGVKSVLFSQSPSPGSKAVCMISQL